MRKITVAFVLLFLTFLSVSAKETPNWRYQINPEEYDTMTLETYNVELAKAQQREVDAKNLIAQEQASIENLKQQIADTEQRIAATHQEIYDILGITEQDVIDAENEIASIRENLQLLLGLSPDELLTRVAEIKDDENRISALKAKPVSLLWKIRDQIQELDELLAQVKANLPDKLASYTVQLIPGRRDCLYRISEKDDIYGDPTKWPQIYSANRDLIDGGYEKYKRYVEDPKYSRPQDIIFPGQVLDIPR